MTHSNWVFASLAVVATTCQWHSEDRTAALQQHKNNVGVLYLEIQNWFACQEYDIMQRKFWAEDLQYDVTILNWNVYSWACICADLLPNAITAAALASVA